MYVALLILHVIIALGLVGVILIQRGRSGGLVEALGGVESIFGTKTSSFFVKLTVVLAVLFFLTSISLAYLSKERGKSLMEKYKLPPESEKESFPQGNLSAASQEEKSSSAGERQAEKFSGDKPAGEDIPAH